LRWAERHAVAAGDAAGSVELRKSHDGTVPSSARSITISRGTRAVIKPPIKSSSTGPVRGGKST